MRLFRVVLLLSVLVNLADAPYLDEIFDTESQEQRLADASTNGPGTSNPSQTPDPVKHPCSGYELLLHLYGVVHDGLTLQITTVASDRPPEKSVFVPFVLRERIDRPPQDRISIA